MTRSRPAFTLVEAVLSTLIIATLFAASLRLVAASRIGQIRSADRVRGVLMASALMSEIQAQSYSEPSELSVLGIEASELLAGRPAWDDVDDYRGFSESPPTDQQGAALPEGSGWTRAVEVDWVRLNDPAQVSAGETGAKRITVTVSRNGLPVARLVAIRTLAKDRS